MTKLALQSYEEWDEITFEPIDAVLPSLSVNGAPATKSLARFALQLGIHADKVNWEWKPTGQDPQVSAPLEAIAYGTIEADNGMDQDLELVEDQKYMGGTKGPSSQGFRHMYYRQFDPREPLATFHFPFHEMGEAPNRAQLFFDLAVQAKKAGHLFWAYRFLGLGLHYVQDIGQPFHANQMGSIKLFPLWTLITRGFEAAVGEATRLSGNFHLTFERYTSFFLERDGENELLLSFKVPRGDEQLRKDFLQNLELTVHSGVRKLAVTSSQLAGSVVKAQDKLMGKLLRSPETDIISGFFDQQNQPKVDFNAIESDATVADQRAVMHDVMFQALSNTGVATRWYVDRFRMAK